MRNVVSTAPTIDHVRAFPNTWEVNAFGQPIADPPAANWARGELLRATAPTFQMPPPAPAFDRTDPTYWNSRGAT